LEPAEQSRLFVPSNSVYVVRAKELASRLPPLSGKPILLFRAAGLRDGRRAVHAGSFLRERSIGFNCHPREFARVCVHELFHFVWWRLGNPRRRAFEAVLQKEWEQGASGELGWSAEWRKQELTSWDVSGRSRSWRGYCCESFCDTAACLFSGAKDHEEFTLSPFFRNRRRLWFGRLVAGGTLPI
jgi:hypothetical protein